MSWNYRIVEDLEGNFFITEVYYNKKGKPTSWVNSSVGIMADSIEGVHYNFTLMQMALFKPRLKVVEKNGKQKLVEWK